MDRIVDVESLNFRSSAGSADDGNIIGKVFLGQRVQAVGAPDADGWQECDADVGGSTRRGFVASKHLRAPLSPTREALVDSVRREWMRFGRGTGIENSDPFAGFVGEMWKSIGHPELDGRDIDVPWSAAAISFMVRRAGPAYKEFTFAAAHARYVHDAIKARENGDRSVPFWGFRLNEEKPQIGDIVCKGRAESLVTFDTARTSDSFKSHCDIIMRIDSPGQKLTAIGGNVSNSVHTTDYALAAGDLLSSSQRVYALLRNITDDPN